MEKHQEQRVPSPSDKPRKPYRKPQMLTEPIFETTALACGKCTSGPFSQFACSTIQRNS
ncbi:MAG: hypothetical protein NZ520_08795 [bacterium]|nr:hypothetical protein [bacterium]MCS7310529.1 hypothetical protein [Armatimonadota bacterium]MDW8104895.1 hypothetical protein [Armatimonadota bacterium]